MDFSTRTWRQKEWSQVSILIVSAQTYIVSLSSDHTYLTIRLSQTESWAGNPQTIGQPWPPLLSNQKSEAPRAPYTKLEALCFSLVLSQSSV